MKRTSLMAGVAGLAMLVAGAEAGAQGRGNAGRVPPGQMPAAGECRVWIDGVPPGRQPAPTSCARARYDAARTGGRVIYGDQASRPGKGKAKGKYKHNGHDDDRWYGRRERDDDDRDDDRDGDRDGDRDERREERRDRRRDDGRYDGRTDDRRRTDGGTYGTRLPSTTTRNGTTTRTRDHVCVDSNRDGKCDFGDRATNGRTVPVQPR